MLFKNCTFVETFVMEKEHLPENNESLETQNYTSLEDDGNFLELLIPTKDFWLTPTLIYINIIVFLLMVFSGVNAFEPTIQDLINWGGNERGLTLDGQLWRLFTCCFVHIGVIHLLFNMYGLLFIGSFLEPMIGKTRFFIAYILSGLGGSVISVYWNDMTVSAGASGAIFGMFGLFLALLSTKLIEPTLRKSLLTSMLVFVGYNLLMGLQDGVDNAAHIGGLLTGAISGYIMVPSLKQNENINLKVGLLILATGVTIGGSTILLSTMDKGKNQAYNVKMNQFAELEEEALKLFNLDKYATDEEYLEFISTRGIPNWEKCIQLHKDVIQMDLNEETKNLSKKLIVYCELRIKQYDLIYKAINESSPDYDDDIEKVVNDIDKLLNELNES